MVCAAPTVPCMSFEQTNHQTEGSRFTFTGLSVSFCHSTKELHCAHAEPHCAHASFVLRLIKHFPFVPYVYATAAPLICPIKRGAGLLILTQQLGVFFFFAHIFVCSAVITGTPVMFCGKTGELSHIQCGGPVFFLRWIVLWSLHKATTSAKLVFFEKKKKTRSLQQRLKGQDQVSSNTGGLTQIGSTVLILQLVYTCPPVYSNTSLHVYTLHASVHVQCTLSL